MSDALTSVELGTPDPTAQEAATLGDLLPSRAPVLAPINASMTGDRYLKLPSLTPMPNGDNEPSATPVRPLNNRLITSDATAQAFAAAMNEPVRAQNLRPQRALLRRHSAREDTIAPSSHDESKLSHYISPRTNLEASSSSLRRSMDTEEGVQHLRAKTPVVLRDKILANRAGVKRMAITSGTTPASFFTAAVLAVAAANDTGDKLGDQDPDEQIQGDQYEELMARFQLRRLQHSMSHISSEEESVSVQPKTARVMPIPIPSVAIESAVASDPSANRTDTASASVPPIPASQSTNGVTYALPRDEPTFSRQVPQTFRETNAAYSIYETGMMTVRGLEGNELSGSEMSWFQYILWKIERWNRRTRRVRRRIFHRLTTPMSPYSWTFAVRSAVVLVMCSFVITFYPYQIAFLNLYDSTYSWLTRALEAFFLLDYVITFNTSILNRHGTLVSSRLEIAWQYMSGWAVPHFFANVPIASILLSANYKYDMTYRWAHFMHALYDCTIRMQQVVHILQLYNRVGKLHVSRSSKSIWGWLLYSRFSHLLRLSWLLVAIILIAHYLACIWKMLQLTSTVPSTHVGFEDYSACFYGAMQLLQGQGLGADTLAQNVFSSFAVLMGSVVLAIIYGHVTMLVSNFNANSTGYQRKMEVVFAIMDKMALPAALRERIHQYYQHLWREYESLDGEIVKFSKDLTHNLALEVSLFKYMELTMHVPFWGVCSPDFQKQLVLSLNVRVYLPDDFIMRRGEISDEFYMINRGVCEIIRGRDSFEHCTAPLRSRRRRSTNLDTKILVGLASTAQSRTSSRLDTRRHSDVVAPTYRVPDANSAPESCMIDITRSHAQLVPGTLTASAQLTRGQSFGEAALLLNYARTANVRAVTYVEMCVLGREAFQNMLARHPEDRKHVMTQMLTWLMGNNEYHCVSCPLKQSVRDVFGEADPADASKINAAAAAELLASTVDPLVEDDALLRFGIAINFRDQLQSLRNNDLASNKQFNVETLSYTPLYSSSSCSCSCSSTHSSSESESEIRQIQNQSRGVSDASLDMKYLGSTIGAQGHTLGLAQLLKSRVAAMNVRKSMQTNTKELPNNSANKYNMRRLSITRKRSSSSPLFADEASIQEDSGGADPGDQVYPGSSRREKHEDAHQHRIDTSRPSRGPLLRQMTSLIGFSKSGPTTTSATESPTRLADQLFQRNEQTSQERRILKRFDTFHDTNRRHK